MKRRIARLAEDAADDAALAGIAPADYAAVLVEIAAAKRGRSLLWSAAQMSGTGAIHHRIHRILNGCANHVLSANRVRLFTATAAAAGVFFSSVIAFAPRAQGQNAPNRPPYLIGIDSERPLPAITSSDAAELESKLTANPEDETTRKSLLWYYDQQHLSSQRTALILWLIQHHPESDLLTSGLTAINAHADPAAASQASALFRAQVEAHPNDKRVLLNAARHLSGLDRVKLIERVASFDPSAKPALAFEYGNTIFVDAMRDPRRLAFSGGAETVNYVKGQIAGSSDAAILGGTAYRLVEASVGVNSASFDYASVRSLAIDLLSRAEALDPNNPEWSNDMEGARRLPPGSVQQALLATPLKSIRVGGNVQKTNLIYAPTPPPQTAHGAVMLEIHIDVTGHVRDARLLSGPDVLADVALNLVRQYVYRPTTLNGTPVEVITTVVMDF